ncbi:PucR family transcriptional regulator [Alkalicoccus daliensis]|uniref:DNA-binding transcriptional regulator, PucR family n=1 Tax=Alkalicoccus daliensis TaxID=745820 RepID=A0A1H0FRG8_9BACI|nr:helix-turn-helix domain-containing protein [Alkalicoccus daliensis]SDN97240.1 DNA-binding transcriptional regulator, PucR family [Alkalicoccus daliensis]
MNTDSPFHRNFDSLEEFVDAVSDRLQCPVTLEDANHHLLAYSSHHDSTDEARISTIISRRVPEKVINRFWKEGIIPKLNQTDEPLVIKPIEDIGLGNRVAISIRRKEEVLGYIWVIDLEGSLTEEDLEDLTLAASKAKNQLQQLNRLRKNKEKNHGELLWQIVTGEAGTHKEIQAQLREIGITTDRSLAVVSFRTQHLDDSLRKKLAYAAQTSQKVEMLIQTFDHDTSLFLVSPRKEGDYEREVLEFSRTLQRRIQGDLDIWSGCGSAVTDYGSLPASYEEAVKVAELKQRFPDELKEVHFFHELGVFRYIDLLERSGKLQELHENPAITKLKNYDREQNSSLLETLEAFLYKDGNMNETAKLLHCHVNTLNYRLKRIQEISGVKLKDPVQKLGLYLDLKLSKHVR